MQLTRLALAVAVFGLAACPREERPVAPPSSTSLPPIAVKPRDGLLFTYYAGSAFETVNELDQIPAERRGWVRVVDLRVNPAQRKDHELVYVADLRQARPDGSYPHVAMPRLAFERSAAAGAGGAAEPPSTRPAAASNAVILYATRWCPACRTARSYLEQHKIPFIEKDIEADAQAAAELLRKAKAAGISPSGVPVLDVRGTLMQGFDPQRLSRLLGR